MADDKNRRSGSGSRRRSDRSDGANDSDKRGSERRSENRSEGRSGDRRSSDRRSSEGRSDNRRSSEGRPGDRRSSDRSSDRRSSYGGDRGKSRDGQRGERGGGRSDRSSDRRGGDRNFDKKPGSRFGRGQDDRRDSKDNRGANDRGNRSSDRREGNHEGERRISFDKNRGEGNRSDNRFSKDRKSGSDRFSSNRGGSNERKSYRDSDSSDKRGFSDRKFGDKKYGGRDNNRSGRDDRGAERRSNRKEDNDSLEYRKSYRSDYRSEEKPDRDKENYEAPESKYEGDSEDDKPKSTKNKYLPQKGDRFTKPKRKNPTHIDTPPRNDGTTRLNKYLAHAGIAARRKADEYITAGFVKVNGEVITEMGYRVKPQDVVEFKDEHLGVVNPVYILINKPKGFLTTTSDDRDRKTVMELIKKATSERVYPVGRLDMQTTGLILVTNDGALSELLAHPRYEVEKVYAATLDKSLTLEHMDEIAAGLDLEDGPIHVDEIAFPDPKDKKKVGLSIHSGRNRIVRRIFEHLGYEVEKLDRVIYAGLTKKDLARGNWRMLKEEEIVKLKHFSQGQKGPKPEEQEASKPAKSTGEKKADKSADKGD
ncbi:MAG: 23S rRNA pseudouridine2605 synthase [Limisphaerales bacterium]|jgi:23S rRNA pseudouridine2605 synthase